MDQSWFTTKKVANNIYLTKEMKFFEGNRANIWLIKGTQKDVIIDCGLGVCNLRQHLEDAGLISPAYDIDAKPCDVICTHVHFDHSGGAHHFNNVFIHEDDQPGLQLGREVETLNYVQPSNFYAKPYPTFSARNYKVPPTNCQPLKDQDCIELGDGKQLEIIHVPGHTKGSIAVYCEQERALFSGDFVYECGYGGNLLDWLPTSSVREYVSSAAMMCDWLADHDVTKLFPGHFDLISRQRVQDLLHEYIEVNTHYCGTLCTSSYKALVTAYFFIGCHRWCPC